MWRHHSEASQEPPNLPNLILNAYDIILMILACVELCDKAFKYYLFQSSENKKMKFILLVVMVVTVPVGAFSRRCRRNSQCGHGGFCRGGSIWRSGYCVSRRPDGHSCNDNNLCRSGQCTCRTCGRKLANGKRCSTNHNCKSGWCNGRWTAGCHGTCKGRVADGFRCYDSNQCSSGQCTCGTCGRKLVNGKRCATNDNCKSGWCNSRVTVGCVGTCKPKLPDHFPCGSRLTVPSLRRLCRMPRCRIHPKCLAFCHVGVRAFKIILAEIWKMGDNAWCESGQCTCGTCGKKLRNGRKCSTNDNCQSGWCGVGITFGCRGKCKRRWWG